MKVTFALVGQSGVTTLKEFSGPGQYTIGRAADMDFRLPDNDRYVSRRHVMIEVAPPSVRMIDLESTNPPHLNGVRSHGADLEDGDELELGYTRFRVDIDATIERRAARCVGCGGAVLLVGDESEPERCPACPPLLIEPVTVTPKRQCHRCGKDIADPAHITPGDTLAPDALYCCRECLPETDAGETRFVSRYELIRRLGGGGMGQVFLVYDRATARLLALKELNQIGNADLAFRFNREIRYLRECRHPSLVRYVDDGLTPDNRPYLVMEYLPDGSLDALLDRRSEPMAGADAVNIMISILDGLHFFHERGFIHRDIKPGNILIDSRRAGEVGGAKLADFGLAYSYSRAGEVRITRRETPMGSMMFIAPEQARDAASAMRPADVYAAGSTLYFALAGAYALDFPVRRQLRDHIIAHPEQWPGIDARTPDMQLIREAAHRLALRLILDPDAQPIPIAERRPDLPPRLTEAIDRAVRKDPAERFASAAEMRDALLAVSL